MMDRSAWEDVFVSTFWEGVEANASASVRNKGSPIGIHFAERAIAIGGVLDGDRRRPVGAVVEVHVA